MMSHFLLAALAAEPSTPTPLLADRTWQVLEQGPAAHRLATAAKALGEWEIELAGVPIDGPLLAPISELPEEELVPALREATGRAIDLEDFLYFLDDVLRAEDRRGERFHVHSGRARRAGIVLHPDEIWRSPPRPRRYGRKAVPVDVPKAQDEIEQPAADADPPGPAWTARYKNPSEREAMLDGLAAERPDADFAARVRDLLDQLEAQGAEVYLASASRFRERGYLLWGSFLLSKASSEAEVEKRAATLDARNTEWGLSVPITWRHPDGWRATIEAARKMADTYDVVYATEKGARSSNHYGGTAVDLIAIAMPRRVTLTAPDGATRSFLLTDPDESRDLSLTPRMVRWIETHFGMKKLLFDYPHWDDRVGD